ncbi:tetratricopeptide repeat protein [Alkalihalobacillus sp. AL-G]|uniref:tetratricopeptide repeat protein n=1 Tax=Alkalihalobacillus sp. AL-G TaxID=2926399 RepID=UPI00272B17B2|nr:tetratricopeptide repeat protein [Alkalihalobacillus sp. AL-G]WLD93654.1 tetratricopeptide repeat protein [Alkalihalobacillus sp. AL-G]
MIGQRIRYYRKTKNLTQEELAKGICSVSYLSKIENGDAKSSEDVIELLCERLGISPEEKQLDVNLVGMLNEWNYLMVLRKYEEAETTHNKIKEYIPLIEDPNTLIRYQLFLTRYFITTNNKTKASKQILELNKYYETRSDVALNFYYHFINGLFNHVESNYSQAIKHFENAEAYIQHTPLNQVELATYYYSVALTQTHLFHNTAVINYAYKALDIFDKEYNFTRSADCQILLGIVNRRIKNYLQSEYHFNQALKFAISFNNSKSLGIIYHNLGFVYSNKGDPEEAIKYYLKSLEIKNKVKDSNLQVTYFLIAKEYYNLENYEESNKWMQKINIQLEKEPNDEYTIHYKILKLRLNQQSGKEYENLLKKQAIPFFEDKNIMEYVCEYSTLLADYYYKNSQYKNASENYKLALKASQKFF